MANNIDIRSLNAMFNDYLKNGGANESFENYCINNMGYFSGSAGNFNFKDFRKIKFVDTSELSTKPEKYQSYIKFLLNNSNQITNDKAAAKTLMDLIEDLPMSAGLGLKEDEAKQLYDNYLSKSEHKMKKMHPKTSFAAKKVGIPIIVTVIICAIVGGAIATSGLVAGALPFLTDSLLLNIGSLATIGASFGAIIAPTVIAAKNAIVKSYYARKYGIKTNNLSQVLSANIQNVEDFNVADIENLNLPISNLFEKFKKTKEKIKQNKHSKNPFKRIGNYFREKTNRNRAHAILDVLKMTNYEIAHTEDPINKRKLETFQKYIVEQTKNLELSRKYADIFTRFRVDKKDKNKIADLKSNHAQEYRKLAISALTKPYTSSNEISEEVADMTTVEGQQEQIRRQNAGLIGQRAQQYTREQQQQSRQDYTPNTNPYDNGSVSGQAYIHNAEKVNRFYMEHGYRLGNQTPNNSESQTSSDPIPTDFWKQYGDMTLGEALDGKGESQRDETTNANQTDRSYIHRPDQVLIDKEDKKYFKDWYKASQELGNRNGRSSTDKSPTDSTTPETPKTTSNKNSTQKDPEEVAKEWENVAKGIVNEINSRSARAQEKTKNEQEQQSKGETSSPKGTTSPESPIIKRISPENRRISPEYRTQVEEAGLRAEKARKEQEEKEQILIKKIKENITKLEQRVEKIKSEEYVISKKKACVTKITESIIKIRTLIEQGNLQEAVKIVKSTKSTCSRIEKEIENYKIEYYESLKILRDSIHNVDSQTSTPDSASGSETDRKDVDDILNGEGNPPAINGGRKGKRVDVIDENGNTTTFYPDNDQ